MLLLHDSTKNEELGRGASERRTGSFLTKIEELILALERRTDFFGEPFNGDSVSLALTNPQLPTPNLVIYSYNSQLATDPLFFPTPDHGLQNRDPETTS